MTNNNIRTAEKNREQVIKDYINKFVGVEYLNLDDDTKPSSPKIYDQIIYKKTETSWELAVCSDIQGRVVTWEVIERDEAWYDHLSVYFSYLYVGDSNWKKFDQFGFTKLNNPRYEIIDFTTENVGIKKVMLGWEGDTDGPILIPGDVHEGLIKLPYADKGTSTKSTLSEIQIGDDLNGLKLDIHFDEINTSLETLIQNHPDYESMYGSIYLISTERYPIPHPWANNKEASWGLEIAYIKQPSDITASLQTIAVVSFNSELGPVDSDGYLLMDSIWSNDNYDGHGITYDADNHEIAFNNSFVVSEFHHDNGAINANDHQGVEDTDDLDDLKPVMNEKIFLVGDLEYDDSGIIKPESDSIDIDDGRLEAKISKQPYNALTLKDDGLYATGGGSGGNNPTYMYSIDLLMSEPTEYNIDSVDIPSDSLINNIKKQQLTIGRFSKNLKKFYIYVYQGRYLPDNKFEYYSNFKMVMLNISDATLFINTLIGTCYDLTSYTPTRNMFRLLTWVDNNELNVGIEKEYGYVIPEELHHFVKDINLGLIDGKAVTHLSTINNTITIPLANKGNIITPISEVVGGEDLAIESEIFHIDGDKFYEYYLSLPKDENGNLLDNPVVIDGRPDIYARLSTKGDPYDFPAIIVARGSYGYDPSWNENIPRINIPAHKMLILTAENSTAMNSNDLYTHFAWAAPAGAAREVTYDHGYWSIIANQDNTGGIGIDWDHVSPNHLYIDEVIGNFDPFMTLITKYNDIGVIQPESDSIDIDNGQLEAKISKETGNALTLKDDGLYATGGGSGGNVNFAEYVYYISTDGNDSTGEGSIDEPFKTFNGAYNKIKNNVKQPFNDAISFKFLHEGDDSETTSYTIDFSNISIYSANNFRFIGDYVNGNEDNPYEIELISRSKLIFDHGSLEIFDLNLTAPSISISNANVKFVNSSLYCSSTSSITNFVDLYNSKVDYVIDSTSKGYNIDCNNRSTNAIILEGNSYFGFNNLIINGSVNSIKNEEGFIFSPATNQGEITGTITNPKPTNTCNCIGYYSNCNNSIKRKTEITMTYDKCIYNEITSITFKLTELSTGMPLRGRELTYILNDLTGTADTDGNGECTITTDKVIRDIEVECRFYSDNEFDGSILEDEILYAYKTELACPPIVATELKNVNIDLHLKEILGPNDGDYNNVVGERIWVKYGILSAYMEYITDEQGMVSIPYTDQVDTIIYAYYDGNDDIEKRLLGSEVISSVTFELDQYIPTKFFNETKTLHRNENIQQIELFVDNQARDNIDRGICIITYYYDANTGTMVDLNYEMNPPRTLILNIDSNTGYYATASKVFVQAVYVDVGIGKKYKNTQKLWAYDLIDDPLEVIITKDIGCIQSNGSALVQIWFKTRKSNAPIVGQPVIINNKRDGSNHTETNTDNNGKIEVTLTNITGLDVFAVIFNPDPTVYIPLTDSFSCINCPEPENIDDINSDTLSIDKIDNNNDDDVISETLNVSSNPEVTFYSQTFKVDRLQEDDNDDNN